MTDEFDQLFGTAVPEEEEDEAVPKELADQTRVLAVVVASMGSRAVVRFPDGQEATIEVYPFESLEPGSPLVLYFAVDGGWSPISPWVALHGGEEYPGGIRRGTKVSFDARGVDHERDALWGTIAGLRAELHRADLPWPHNLPSASLSDWVGTPLEVKVLDPTTVPIRLCERFQAVREEQELLRLHALAEIAAEVPSCPVPTVRQGDFLGARIYGQPCELYAEELSWYKDVPVPAGAPVLPLRLVVDVRNAKVSATQRLPTDAEWAEVKACFPVGREVTGATRGIPNARGLNVTLPHDKLLVTGVVPYEQMRPTPVHFGHPEALPEPFTVVGHDEIRCCVVLDLAHYVQQRWASLAILPDQIIPVEVIAGKNVQPVALFGPNLVARVRGKMLPGAHWARVVSCVPDSRELVVEGTDEVREGVFGWSERNRPEVRFADGSVGELSFDGTLSDTPVGSLLKVYPERIAFGANLVRTIVRPLHAHEARSRFERLVAAKADQTILPATVLKKAKGGFRIALPADLVTPVAPVRVDYPSGTCFEAGEGAIIGFLPGSETSPADLRNPDAFLGQIVDVVVAQVDPARENVVVSRKQVVEAQRLLQVEALLPTLVPGAVLLGTVKNIVEYGVFLDLGGVDGLLHNQDMVRKIPALPGELFQLGDTVRVAIVGVVRSEKGVLRVSLSTKELTPDPWNTAADRYAVGSKVSGRVVRLPDFGIFVELEPGLDGLVHNDELPWNARKKAPYRAYTLGETVEVMVIAMDTEQRRLSLSVKAFAPGPWELFVANNAEGDLVVGPVRSVMDYGVFVAIHPEIDGLLHSSHMIGNPGMDEIRARFSVGQIQRASIFLLDVAGRRVSLAEVPSELPPRGPADALEPAVVTPEPPTPAVRAPEIVQPVRPVPGVSAAGIDDAAPSYRALGVGCPGVGKVYPSASLAAIFFRWQRKRSEYAVLAESLGLPVSPEWEAPPVHAATTALEPLLRMSRLTATLAITRANLRNIGGAGVQIELREPEVAKVLAALGFGTFGREDFIPDAAWERLVRWAFAQSRWATDAAADTVPQPVASPDRPRQPHPSVNMAHVDHSPPDPVIPVASRPATVVRRRGVATIPVPQAEPPLRPLPVLLRRAPVQLTRAGPSETGSFPGQSNESATAIASHPPAAYPEQPAPAPGTLRVPAMDTPASELDDEFWIPEPREADDGDDEMVEDEPSYEGVRLPGQGTRYDVSALLDRLLSGGGAPRESDALLRAGFVALHAFFGDTRPDLDDEPPPLLASATVQIEAKPPGALARAEPLEAALRWLLADPADAIPVSVIADEFGAQTFLRWAPRLERWLDRTAKGRDGFARLAIHAAMARCAIEQGDFAAAQAGLDVAASISLASDVQRERRALPRAHLHYINGVDTFFGRYRRRRDISVASGGFSIVVPVVDGTGTEVLALKIARRNGVSPEAHRVAAGQLIHEATVLQTAGPHPALPRFVACPEREAALMTWVDGLPLHQYEVRPGQWAAADVLALARRVVGAMCHLHLSHPRLVHHDLAPRNILVPDGHPELSTLIDFGLATAAGRSNGSLWDDMELEAHTRYRAPEVRQGGTASPQSDMYALGLVLLELLDGGEPPQNAHSASAALLAVRAKCGSAFRSELLAEMLAESASARPTTWEVLRMGME